MKKLLITSIFIALLLSLATTTVLAQDTGQVPDSTRIPLDQFVIQSLLTLVIFSVSIEKAVEILIKPWLRERQLPVKTEYYILTAISVVVGLAMALWQNVNLIPPEIIAMTGIDQSLGVIITGVVAGGLAPNAHDLLKALTRLAKIKTEPIGTESGGATSTTG